MRRIERLEDDLDAVLHDYLAKGAGGAKLKPQRDIAAVLSHGIVKEKQISAKDIEQAIEHKHKFEKDPQRHTHEED